MVDSEHRSVPSMTAQPTATVVHGDCLDVLRGLPDAWVDAVVTDPPYGLEFMGKDWDSFKTYPGGNPNMKPQHATVGGGETGNDFAAASYGYRQKNPRCRRCGKLKRGNGSCKCPEPQWDTRTAESANVFQAWCEDWAAECMRVLKPGGHLLAFGGTRTWHRLTAGIEDAGFEIRDSIAWLYGSGFPKSLDVSKAIDKARNDRSDGALVATWLRDAVRTHGWTAARLDAALGGKHQAHNYLRPDLGRTPPWDTWVQIRDFVGFGNDMDAEVWRLNGRKGTPGAAWDAREVLGVVADRRGDGTVIGLGHSGELNRATSADAERWQGWGTALKPAFEPVVVARKPLVGTVAANVLAHGTGALNIDASRIAYESDADMDQARVPQPKIRRKNYTVGGSDGRNGDVFDPSRGRWPANVILDESQAAALNEQSGTRRSAGDYPSAAEVDGALFGHRKQGQLYADQGGASRFFYVAKAPSKERPRGEDGTAHPTVKPLALMRWLVRLVTPPGGWVLEPFAGSGTTVEACLLEGFNVLAVEREAEYLPLIEARIARAREMLSEAAVTVDP